MVFLLVSLLFLRSVKYAFLKCALREALISLHCKEVSVLCLPSFEKVQRLAEFCSRLAEFYYTKHLTAERCEIP